MRIAWLLSCSLLAGLAGRAAAQPEPQPRDGKLVVPLTLTPAAAPRPVADYYLLPEYRDMQPGERLAGFLKCFMEQNTFFNQENTEKRDKWLAMPLTELPSDVREQAGIKAGIAYDPPYATLMVFMDQAARYTRIEWNEWFNLRHDAAYTLLPEVQKLRSLAPVLVLRMRGEVKSGEFHRATATAKTLLGLAKTFDTHPTLIGGLVGIAIASPAVNALEEMVGQPGCPNLFWSFADLPAPFIDLRTGLSGERLFIAAQFPGLLKADRPLADEELGKYLRQIDELAGMATESGKPKPERPSATYAAWASDKDRVEASRKRLVEHGGFRVETVQRFSPMQVVVTDDLVRYEIHRDEILKWLHLPYAQARAGVAEEEAKLKKAYPELVLARHMLPACQAVKQAQARLDQRIAYLRVVEAVRLFAHENGGRLPATLDEIKLPLPADPLSGKPFEYAVKDGVATLHGGNPNPGQERTNRYYELRIAK